MKRPEREIAHLFFMKTSPLAGFAGSLIYNGEMVCGDSSFPFIMGAAVDGTTMTLIFYSFSGNPLLRARQVAEGLTYRFQIEKSGSGGQEVNRGFLRLLSEIGSEFSMIGLMCGKLPFGEREGDLYQTRKGFLFEGEDFRVETDRYMRVQKADYGYRDWSIEVSYAYTGEESEVPSALKIFSSGCSFNLDVEQMNREIGGNG